MNNVFFTSDEHYGHNNIIEHCKRPFADVAEMRETLIERHNQVVAPGDRVYHLGDMFWRTLSLEECMSIMDRLNGEHYYILGNHEEAMEKYEALRNRFIWVRDISKFYWPQGIKRQPIVLCHYAMRVWPGSHRLAWQLYGHSHGELPEDRYLSMDVGVDCNDYRPISLDQVEAHLGAKSVD